MIWKRVAVLALLIISLSLGLYLLIWGNFDLRRAASTSNFTPKIQKHLFLDTSLVDENKSNNYAIRVHSPENFRLVITTDKPWEANGYHYFSQVMDYNLPFNNKNYRYILYYGRWNLAGIPGINDEGGYYCSALSNDGINWIKPIFSGSTKFNGQNTNCLKYPTATNFVLSDPNAPADKRFKVFGKLDSLGEAWGIAGYSADGLHFTDVDHRLGPINRDGTAYVLDSQNVVLWDDQQNKYHFYLRGRSGDLKIDDNQTYTYKNVERTVNYGEITQTNLLKNGLTILDKSNNPYPIIVNQESIYRLSSEA